MIGFQLRLKNLYRIEDIFRRYFEIANFFEWRCDYTIVQYQTKTIPWNYPVYRRALWIQIRAWILIAYTFTSLFIDDDIYCFQLNYFESILKTERLDLLGDFILIVLLILEYIWFRNFRSLRTYRLGFNNVIGRMIHYDKKRLTEKNHQILINKYNLMCLIYIGLYQLSRVIFSSLIIVLFILFKIGDDWDQIIFSFIIMFLAFLHSEIILGLFFVTFVHFTFTFEFLKTRLKQICVQAELLKNRNHSDILSYTIRKEYGDLFYETSTLNQTAQYYFMLHEALTKTSMIVGTIFFSRQIAINLFNSLVLFSVTAFSKLNKKYYKILNNWCCRLIISRNSKPLGLIIKNGMFIQKIQNNRLGFNLCGLYEMTAFKHLESFLLNFVFVLMFYKKFIMNTNKLT
ncbi:hypothetical protein QR98_0098500 [Sarcoptes scabiei]|uniref:Gustatory receptor n=1 Tax=Sarcoptes scabiei TaxID=52283 RepID=A0A132ALG0_SARSC|nr:hypothetical protein QR98_0098500 [Sarcoptes scabiei]